MKQAKLVIEVTAGLIPGQPDPQHTRRWALSTEECEDGYTMSDALGASREYAAVLAHPSVVNWVRHDWVWL